MIEDDPAEALDRLLGKRGGGMTADEAKEVFRAEVPCVRFENIPYGRGFRALVFNEAGRAISPVMVIDHHELGRMTPTQAQARAIELGEAVER